MFVKQGKTNLKYLLIVVILATIVGGGIIYCQYTLVECKSSTDCEGKTHIMCVGEWECINNQCSWNCQAEEEQELEDETADWQTYRNEMYGYGIKYPQDWTIGMEIHLKEAAPRIVSPESAEISGVLQIGTRSLEEVPLPSSATAIQAAEQDKNVPYFTKRIIGEGEVIIAGARGYRIIFITEYEGTTGPQEVAVQMVYLVHGGRLYTLSYKEQMSVNPYTYTADHTKWKYADILDQMLSTFRFLE